MPTSRATTDDDDWRLKVAEYVVTNSPVWTEPEGIPKAGLDDEGNLITAEFTAQRIVGGNIIVGESKKDISRGFSFAYPTIGLQGVSRMQGAGVEPPLIYASMGPDQYVSPEPKKLNDLEINSISEILGLQEAISTNNFKEALSKMSFNDLVQFSEKVETASNESNLEIKFNKNLNVKLADVVANKFGVAHVQKIKEHLGTSYVAISLSGDGSSEVRGFGLSPRHPHPAVKQCNMGSLLFRLT